MQSAVVNNEYDGAMEFVNGYGQMWEFHNHEQYGGLMDVREFNARLWRHWG